MAWALSVRIVVPPLKSMPKFSPCSKNETKATTTITPDMPSHSFERPKKLKLVFSGTSRRRILHLQGFGAAALEPDSNQQPCYKNGCEYRRHNTKTQRDGKAAHRARAHDIQDHSRDKGGDVGIDNRAHGFFIAQLDGARWATGCFELFANTL